MLAARNRQLPGSQQMMVVSVLASVVHLAQSSLPAVDYVLGISAYMMLSPHLIQEGEKLDCVSFKVIGDN